MGEPVPIRLLAEQMIRLAGKQPRRDIAIVYTGLRPGEKLHETLFHADERYRPTSHPEDPAGRGARQSSPSASRGASSACATPCARYDLEELAACCCAMRFRNSRRPTPCANAASATVVAFPARNARKI